MEQNKKLITINLSYYNQNKKVVLQHINYWKNFNKDILQYFTFTIIDDCSKIPINELLNDIDVSSLDLNLYRIKKDLYCNIAGVRNLGAKECKTPYMVILDMDTMIDNVLAQSLVKLATENKDNKIVFKFNRVVLNNPNHCKNKPHPAICLLRLEDYWYIGGCEEDLVGNYGYTDPLFWYRAREKKIEIKIRKDLYLIYTPEGESDINRDINHNRKLFEEKKKMEIGLQIL